MATGDTSKDWRDMLQRQAGDDFERDWRSGVMRSIDDSARSQQATAVILERVKLQLDSHDSRIKSLEERPAKAAETKRNDVLMICAIIGSIVALTTCGSGLLSIAVAVLLHFAH